MQLRQVSVSQPAGFTVNRLATNIFPMKFIIISIIDYSRHGPVDACVLANIDNAGLERHFVRLDELLFG